MGNKIKKPDLMNAGLITPCGMNCALCYAYLREKNHCSGCLSGDKNKPQYCITCKIKNCYKMAGQNNIQYCNECLKKINQLNMYEIVHSFGRFLVENNKKSHEIEDSKEKELYGCVIMTKEEIKLFIDNITKVLNFPNQREYIFLKFFTN